MDWQKVLASKTVWLNVMALVLAVLALPEFISVIPASGLPYITLTAGVLNLVLRTIGGQPLTKA